MSVTAKTLPALVERKARKRDWGCDDCEVVKGARRQPEPKLATMLARIARKSSYAFKRVNDGMLHHMHAKKRARPRKQHCRLERLMK